MSGKPYPDHDTGNVPKGFAGFDSLVTGNVDQIIADAFQGKTENKSQAKAKNDSSPTTTSSSTASPPPTPNGTDGGSNAPPASPAHPAPQEIPKQRQQPIGISSPSSLPDEEGSKWKSFLWVIGFFGLMVILPSFCSSDKKTLQQADREATQPAQTIPDTSVVEPSPTPSTTQAVTRPTEEIPPVGSDNLLSFNQLRYCFSEKIRLDAAEEVVNNYVGGEVDRFNTMVGDYNSRCGKFRYRQGALEATRAEVEKYRLELTSEGRHRFASEPSATTPQGKSERSSKDLGNSNKETITAPAAKKPDPTVLEIQKKLNTLGYDAGPADGFAGKKTIISIKAFQRDQNLPINGIVNTDLLTQLNDLKQKGEEPRNLSHKSPTPQTSAYTSSQTRAPSNSYFIGEDWYCNAGYAKTANDCVKVKAPSNSYFIGEDWYCNAGYTKTTNDCVKVKAPSNSYFIGEDWYCNAGYAKTANDCVKVKAPSNSYFIGEDWYCNSGYVKTANDCVSVGSR